jgi:hypothetical protein
VHPAFLPETVVGTGERDELHLGLIALCAGAVDGAIAHLEAAVPDLLKTRADILLTLGRAYLAQGRREDAVRQFEEALTTAAPAETNANALGHVRVWPNALSGIEEATGSAERVRHLVERLRHAHPGATALPLVPCLAPAVVGPGLPQHLHEAFTTPLAPDWTWHDPFGDCSFAPHKGLQIAAANGRDLWHVNLSAPRLLRPSPSGDFAVQTTCDPMSDARPAIGGLLLWQDREHYLVLERGHWGTADISLRRCWDNEDRIVGRGWLPGEHAWLRLERQGTTVRALCSADGAAWFSAGAIEFAVRAGEQVGVHAIGLIDRTIYQGAYPEGTAICFRSVELWTAAAAGESTHNCAG